MLFFALWWSQETKWPDWLDHSPPEFPVPTNLLEDLFKRGITSSAIICRIQPFKLKFNYLINNKIARDFVL